MNQLRTLLTRVGEWIPPDGVGVCVCVCAGQSRNDVEHLKVNDVNAD